MIDVMRKLVYEYQCAYDDKELGTTIARMCMDLEQIEDEANTPMQSQANPKEAQGGAG